MTVETTQKAELTIFKYKLELTDVNTISCPNLAEILTVQNQNGIICVWCLVNLNNANAQYRLGQFRKMVLYGIFLLKWTFIRKLK